MEVILDCIRRGLDAKGISEELKLPLEIAEQLYQTHKDLALNGTS